MTPARLAEIRAYVERLDLDQLPGWTVEQRIIQDLWETLESIRALADDWREWDDATIHLNEAAADIDTALGEDPANPYRAGPR